MGTRTELLDWASAQVGHVGGEKYWQILQGWSGGGYDWCAVFVSCALKVTGTPCAYFPSTFAFDWIHDHEAIGDAWVDGYELQPGDLVSFHWPVAGDTRPLSGDHVGIVERVIGYGYYQTIEGNVSNSVGRRYRRVSDGIIGGIRPRYEEETVAFKDVTKKTPHAEDIDWMERAGIAKGFPDGTFRPYEPLTRADAAAMFRRFYDLVKK